MKDKWWCDSVVGWMGKGVRTAGAEGGFDGSVRYDGGVTIWCSGLLIPSERGRTRGRALLLRWFDGWNGGGLDLLSTPHSLPHSLTLSTHQILRVAKHFSDLTPPAKWYVPLSRRWSPPPVDAGRGCVNRLEELLILRLAIPRVPVVLHGGGHFDSGAFAQRRERANDIERGAGARERARVCACVRTAGKSASLLAQAHWSVARQHCARAARR